MDLGKHFEPYGEIMNVKIIDDDKGRSMGYGYI